MPLLGAMEKTPLHRIAGTRTPELFSLLFPQLFMPGSSASMVFGIGVLNLVGLLASIIGINTGELFFSGGHLLFPAGLL